MNDNEWTTEDRLWPLVEGAHAFTRPGTAGGQLAVTPGGEYVDLRLDELTWTRLREILDGRLSPAVASAELPDAGRAALTATLDVLWAEGLVQATSGGAPDDPGSPVTGTGLADRGEVLIVGTTLVAAALAEILAGQAVTVRVTGGDGGELSPADLRGVAVVVACAGWLPDPDWRHLDDLCRAADVPWHRCWREGGDIWLGPFSVPGHSVSYHDLRLRRLAACDWPDELAATWEHLASSARRVPPQWAPGVPALMAATLATDLFTWFGRGPLARRPAADAGPAAAGNAPVDIAFSWRGWDATSRQWHRHPVLPLPAAVLVDTPDASAAGHDATPGDGALDGAPEPAPEPTV